MVRIKDDSKLQIPLKIDKNKEKKIYDVLSVANNKSDFIKDALFYFIYNIEQGKIINRNYPYNDSEIYLVDKNEMENSDIENNEEDSPHNNAQNNDLDIGECDDNFDGGVDI